MTRDTVSRRQSRHFSLPSFTDGIHVTSAHTVLMSIGVGVVLLVAVQTCRQHDVLSSRSRCNVKKKVDGPTPCACTSCFDRNRAGPTMALAAMPQQKPSLPAAAASSRRRTLIVRVVTRSAKLALTRLRSSARLTALLALAVVIVLFALVSALDVRALLPLRIRRRAAGRAAAAPRDPDTEDPRLLGPSAAVLRARVAQAAARNATSGVLGNKFCVIQPTLSAGKPVWTEGDAMSHIALRAFMRTFTDTVTEAEKAAFRFAVYYGHNSDDPVFGDVKLRGAFERAARQRLRDAGFEDERAELNFVPMYGLAGRVNAIWNVLVKDAYYDGCDYFFMSNDDMVFFTKGWVTTSVQSLDGIGSSGEKKRPCRYFGTVRFKDEWAKWATFTFHVSTRLHVEIFGGTYYPVPYNAAHNDYWIHYVYKGFESSKYRSEIRVRNRVEDVDFALSHQKDTKHIAPPRYEYDKKGDVKKYIRQGRARVERWLRENHGTANCLPTL